MNILIRNCVEGFMIGTSVLDKDGVSAAAAMAELTIYLAAQGSTLMSHLNQLYHRYMFAMPAVVH